MNSVIKAENLSKAYQLGQFSTGTLSMDLKRWWALMRGFEDPFLKIGETSNQSTNSESKFVWSLKDLNFEVNQGDAVGIIGRNGAGKSTLLKILSQITAPTKGSVKVKGRIASLLEVGTGFHPELTGRENIFLNGAMLGMRSSEIKRKFDEIVAFSGVERYIDTPVKRYSSGMYVRLAFAVAAHLESEILVVDEVLAVGDAEFQRKCLGKMSEVSKGEGRTVLFVSHNLPSIKRLCNNCIYLEKGQLIATGPTDDILKLYAESDLFLKELRVKIRDLNTDKKVGFNISEISIEDQNGRTLTNVTTDQDLFVHIKGSVTSNNINTGVTFILKDIYDTIVFSSINNASGFFDNSRNSNDEISAICVFPKGLLNDELYKLNILLYNANYSNAYLLENVISFQVEDGHSARGNFSGKMEGIIRPQLKWLIS